METSNVAHKINSQKRTNDVLLSENVDFAGLLLSDPVQKGLISAGFERPSPIQLKAIPLGRCGLDLIVQAKSGTGKTCVFSVVALESLQLKSSALQVLVLAPTREIAVQIQDVINSIGVFLPRLACHTFIGGLPVKDDIQKLKRCHIAIGSPGRVKQLIESGLLSTESIRLLVLDEADKLLEESFQDQINWIYSSLPENKQILALSATYPEYLANHLTAYMRNPTFIRLNISDPALLGIKQYYMQVPHHPLPNKDLETKTKAVVEILSSITFKQCLIFSNYQTRAQNLCSELQDQGWPTTCIAGSLDQKERLAAMNQLKTYQCRVLISTDLTSRGIDADKVDLVINLDVPYDHETYLHRIGRAGRYGSFGAAISIVSRGKEESELHAVEKKCNTNIWPVPDPLPVDLVKKDIPLNIDDIISTEQIQTIKATAINGRSSHEKTEINEHSKDIISNNSGKRDKLSCDDKNTNNSLITSSETSVQDELFGKMDNLSDKDMKQSTQKFIYQEDKTELPNLSLNVDSLKQDCSTSNSPVVDVRDITDSVVSFKKSPKARTVVVEESVKTNEKLDRNPSETRDLNNSHSLPLNITDSMNSINLKTKDSDELDNVSFNLKTSALKTENCGSNINMNNSIISAKTNSKYSKKVNCLNVCTKSETPVSEDIKCDLSDVTENFDNQSSAFKQPDKFNTNLLKVMEKTEVDSNHENQTDDKVVLQKCCQDVLEAVQNLNLENVMSVDLRNSRSNPSSNTMDAVEISSSAQSINPKAVSAKNETSNTKDITDTKAGSDVKNKKLRNGSRYQEKLKRYDEFKNSETKCDYNYVARICKDIQGSVKNIPSIETSREGLARIDQIYSTIRQQNIGMVQTTSRETQTQDSATGDLRVPHVPSTNRETKDNSKTMEESKMQLNGLKINKMISPDSLESNLKDVDDRLRNPSLQEFHPKLAKVCVSNQNGIASLSDVLDSSTPSKTSENIFQESDSEIAESSSSTSITSDSDSSLSSESEDERSCRKKDSDYFLTYKKSYGHQQCHRVTENERGQFGARVDYRLPHNYFHANTWFYDQGYPYPYDDDRSISKFTESSHNQRKNNAKKWSEPSNFESGSHRRDSGEMISERRKPEHRQAPLHKEKSKPSFIKSHQEDEDLSKQASRRPKKEKMEQPGKTKYSMFDSANYNNNYTESGYDYYCPRNKHGNPSYSSYPYYSMDPYYYKQSYDFYRNYPMNPYYREPYYNYYPNYPQPRPETIEESMKQMQTIAKIQRDYIRKMSRK